MDSLAALAPAGWDEPLVLLGIGFAALSGYAWLDPARKEALAWGGATEKRPGRRGWFGGRGSVAAVEGG